MEIHKKIFRYTFSSSNGRLRFSSLKNLKQTLLKSNNSGKAIKIWMKLLML